MSIRSRWQVNLTYKCNLNCKWCLQYMDVLSYPDSFITIEDIKEGAVRLKNAGIDISFLRVSGGEPLVHPNFEECSVLIGKLFGYTLKYIICTNGIIKGPSMEGIGYRRSPPSQKPWKHQPAMVSPADLGIEPVYGFNKGCKVIRRCGRLFDTYGFAPCGNAGCIGRVLGIDPYNSNPVLLGKKEMCEHCDSSLPDDKRMELFEGVKSGKIEYPTKTYKEGLVKEKENPTTFKLFSERIKEET